MRLVVQRVSKAAVTIDGIVVGAIDRGLAVLVGVRRGDTENDADQLAGKTYALRVFGDVDGKMNLSATDVAGQFLAISQFTLYADTSRGRRPSFVEAADPETGKRVYERYVVRLRELGGHVETGRFGASMMVNIVNDGPVTIILETEAQV